MHRIEKKRLLLTLIGASLVTACQCGGVGGRGDGGSADGASLCTTDAECSGALVCVDGACLECRDDGQCGAGKVCQSGLCMQVCDPADLCTAGGSCCPGRDECVDGACLPPCDGARCGPKHALCCGAGEVCEAQRCLPECPSGVRCGNNLETCCGTGQICYGTSCTDASIPCAAQIDCPSGMVCERNLGVCIDGSAVGTCEYHPPAGVFTPRADCRWRPKASDPHPNRRHVVMAPVVGNLTDDNGDGKTDTFDIPDIAFISYDRVGDGCCNVPGTLRIVDGRCQSDGSMRLIASIDAPDLDNSGGLALGDLDGDGVPEIVAILNDRTNAQGKNLKAPQGTVAFKRAAPDGSAWTVLWRNDTYPKWNVHQRGGAQPAIVNLDGQGAPEVVIGNVVLDGATGALVWDGVVTSNGQGGIGNNAFLGPVSTAADIDRDGQMEVIAGNTVYESDGRVRWTYPYTTSNSPCGAQGNLTCDGFDGVGNFDRDAEAEVVIVRQGEVFVLDTDGTLIARIPIPVDDCPRNESGPPTIADFDGDGRPEIGTAAGDFYVVADLDCLGSPPPTGCTGNGVLWAVPNQDCSSRVTASSVFDFDGDGKAEVVYADETSFRIFDGTTGQVLFTDAKHASHTRLEEPVIADVDNDGNAEVIIAEAPGTGNRTGIVVWSDANDNWVFTRRIWNQHSYHVTNVSERGEIPLVEPRNWEDPALNNFRQNVQGEGLFWAPDLVIVNLEAACRNDASTGQTFLDVAFDLMNQGSRMVPAGVAATVFLAGGVAGTVHSQQALLPGQREHLTLSTQISSTLATTTFDVSVRADFTPNVGGAHNECDNGGEDNNETRLTGFACDAVLP